MIEPLLHRVAIEALLSELAYRLDHGRADDAGELFTDDATFAAPVVTLRGAAELAAGFGMRARQTHVTRHVHSNLRLQLEDDRAVGTAVLTVYRDEITGSAATRPFLVADCHDVYVLGADNRWRFAERTIAPVFFVAHVPPTQSA